MGHKNPIMNGYKLLAWNQSISLSKTFNLLSSILYPLLNRRMKDMVTFRYDKKLLNYFYIFDKEINFRNPISGQERNVSLDTLLEEAISKSVDLCLRIEATIFDDSELFLYEIGPSLKSGIPSTSVDDFKYFKNEFFEIDKI